MYTKAFSEQGKKAFRLKGPTTQSQVRVRVKNDLIIVNTWWKSETLKYAQGRAAVCVHIFSFTFLC